MRERSSMGRKIKRVGLVAAGLFLGFVTFQLAYGGHPGDAPSKGSFEVLAHRGVHAHWKQGTYDRRSGCEAQNLYPPSHPFIENTLESIAAAFDMGATMVELDIRRSSDGHLVVFHDWMLECRTEGRGKVSDHTLAALKQLDIGYGYTHDGGKSYPFRGKGVGKMPTLVEVLQAFPDRKLLIHDKDGSQETTRLLVGVLKSLPPQQQRLLHYDGSLDGYGLIREELPSVARLFGSRQQVKQCLLPYLLTLGLSGLSEECRGLGLGMPARYTRIVPGWPYRFLGEVAEVDARFYLLVDTEEEVQASAGLPLDGVVTDYIEVIGKHY